MELKDLQNKYKLLEKKYKLPLFDKLNEDFEIAKIDRDPVTLLKAIRKTMMEKIVNSLGFLEMLLNPISPPRMYYAYTSTISQEDRKIISSLYSRLAILSLHSLEREIDYDEKAEAELIKDIAKTWDEIKSDFTGIIKKIKNPNSFAAKKEKTYFG